MNQVILRAIFEFTIELQFTKENDDNSFVYHVEGNSLNEQENQTGLGCLLCFETIILVIWIGWLLKWNVQYKDSNNPEGRKILRDEQQEKKQSWFNYSSILSEVPRVRWQPLSKANAGEWCDW